MRNQEKLNKVKELINNLESNNDFSIDLKTQDKDHYHIVIKKVICRCYLCKDKYHISRLSLRQDKRVQNLITPKLFCVGCKKKVDKALDLIKPEVPKHLQIYTP